MSGSALASVEPLRGNFPEVNPVVRRQWDQLRETGLRPTTLLAEERRVLEKVAQNPASLDEKERETLDQIYGEVFNAVGVPHITDEEHLLRAYKSGDPHQYIIENTGLVAADGKVSGIGVLNAEVLHDCVDQKRMPAPCSSTKPEDRAELKVMIENHRPNGEVTSRPRVTVGHPSFPFRG